MNFANFLFRRLIQTLITLLGLVLVIFVISRVIPGDPARLMLGPSATDAQVATYRSEMGLDLPVWSQFTNYVVELFQGNLGQSTLTQQPVMVDLASRLPATLQLVITAIIFTAIGGILLGALAARFKGSWFDSITRVLALIGVSSPSFFIGIVFQIIFGYWLNLFPVTGYLSVDTEYTQKITGMPVLDGLLTGNFALAWDGLRHLILPALALSIVDMGQIARVTRANMLDNSRKDYLRAQRSYGIPGAVLTFKYLLRPSFMPTLTLLGLGFGAMLSNAFLLEVVYSLPGVAKYAADSILRKDLNAIMGVSLTFGVIFMIANIAVDFIAGVINPRIRLGDNL